MNFRSKILIENQLGFDFFIHFFSFIHWILSINYSHWLLDNIFGWDILIWIPFLFDLTFHSGKLWPLPFDFLITTIQCVHMFFFVMLFLDVLMTKAKSTIRSTHLWLPGSVLVWWLQNKPKLLTLQESFPWTSNRLLLI